MKPQTIHPQGWAPALGYSNGMLMADGTLHIGGQIGWDKDKIIVQGGFIAQMEQALVNIAEIVRTAGGDVTDIGRLTWFVKNKDEYLSRVDITKKIKEETDRRNKKNARFRKRTYSFIKQSITP